MTVRAAKRLRDALAACQKIEKFTDGKDFAAYEADDLLRSGVERQLGIVGDALRKAWDEDERLVQLIPELPNIVGLRNRVIHGYDAVDDELVWDVVQTKLAVLERQIRELLDSDV